MNATELKKLSESGYAGYDKEQLMELCLLFGLKPHQNSGVDKLQNLLEDQLAKMVGKKKLNQDLIQGLRGFPWKGLKKLVHLRRDASTGKAKKLPVSWNGHNIMIPYDRSGVSIPWPHYLIVRGAETARVSVSNDSPDSPPTISQDGVSKYNIEDQGDDLNSHSKFKSLAEYFLSEWESIKNMSSKDKATVLSQLTDGTITRSTIEAKKWDEHDVDTHLRALLGVPDDDEG